MDPFDDPPATPSTVPAHTDDTPDSIDSVLPSDTQVFPESAFHTLQDELRHKYLF